MWDLTETSLKKRKVDIPPVPPYICQPPLVPSPKVPPGFVRKKCFPDQTYWNMKIRLRGRRVKKILR